MQRELVRSLFRNSKQQFFFCWCVAYCALALWGCTANSGVAVGKVASGVAVGKVASGVAVGKVAPDLSVPPSAQEPRLFAWELRMGQASFTLLGSVHVGRKELYPLDSRLESRFADSDALVVELDSGRFDKSEVAEQMQKHGRLAPGQTLRQLLSAETLGELSRVLDSRGQSLDVFEALRPWLIATVLTQQSLREAGFEARFGIDEHFRTQAVGSGKRIVSLETLSDQMSLLSGLGREAEESLLNSTLQELKLHKQQLSDALQLWQRGDSNSLDALLLEPLRVEHPGLFERIFVFRNRRMIQGLRRLAEQPGHYFVVVGAGHLVGRSGMVDLFARQGIVARQL